MTTQQTTATDPAYHIGERVQVRDDVPQATGGAHGTVVGDTASSPHAPSDGAQVIVALDQQGSRNAVLPPEALRCADAGAPAP